MRAALVAAALLACTRSPAPDPEPVPDLGPSLDRIEERLIHAAALRVHWRTQAYAHADLPQLACTDVALTRRPGWE